MSRKLDHWLNAFVEWTLPRSEARESLILWAGLFSIAAAIRRRVWIPKEYLGSWEAYPFLYLMFVAPPGLRKTTTLNYALELFEHIPDLVPAPNACSQAALSERLVSSPDTSCYIVAEEFSDLLLKSGNEMYEFLTSAYDGRKKFETVTISRGVEFIEKPCINMAAGTTPLWISENMPEAAIGGGFASRVVFLFENTLRRKKLFHTDFDYEEGEKLKLDLISDLQHIAKNVAGPFKLSDEVRKWAEDWYQEHNPSAAPPKLQGYFQRKHVHLLKVAMLWHLSYSDDLELTVHDMESALALLEQTIEPKLKQVFEGVGKNVYAFDMKDMVKYINEKQRVSRKEILSAFKAVATPAMLNELLLGLIAMGEITAETTSDDIIYSIVNPI